MLIPKSILVATEYFGCILLCSFCKSARISELEVNWVWLPSLLSLTPTSCFSKLKFCFQNMRWKAEMCCHLAEGFYLNLKTVSLMKQHGPVKHFRLISLLSSTPNLGSMLLVW